MPDYVETWGLIAPTTVASNVLLAGSTLTTADYTDALYIVDDPGQRARR